MFTRTEQKVREIDENARNKANTENTHGRGRSKKSMTNFDT